MFVIHYVWLMLIPSSLTLWKMAWENSVSSLPNLMLFDTSMTFFVLWKKGDMLWKENCHAPKMKQKYIYLYIYITILLKNIVRRWWFHTSKPHARYARFDINVPNINFGMHHVTNCDMLSLSTWKCKLCLSVTPEERTFS